MSKLRLWVGTFNDKTILDSLKKHESPMIYVHEIVGEEMLSDDIIQKEVIEKGRVRDCITWFFAKDLAKAKSMAREMGLKNFSKVCDELYEEGKDY